MKMLIVTMELPARLFYLKGWAENIAIHSSELQIIIQTTTYLLSDLVSMEMVVQKYALFSLFWDTTSPDKMSRMNNSLDIQWAIDIKNSIKQIFLYEKKKSNYLFKRECR